MRLKLTLDRGNTCIKAALWSEDGQLVARELGDESQSAGDLVEQLASRHLAEGEIFDAIAWCTVVESEHADDEASLVGKARRVIELTAATPMHLRIAYQTPATLRSSRRHRRGRNTSPDTCLGHRHSGNIRLCRCRLPLSRRQYRTRNRIASPRSGSIHRRTSRRRCKRRRNPRMGTHYFRSNAQRRRTGPGRRTGILPSRRRQRRNSRHNRRISRASCKSQFTHIRLHIRPLPRSQGSLQHYKR